MKNNLTIIIGVGAILMVGAAILGYYLGFQKYDDNSYIADSRKKANEKELNIDFAPNGMPMDLYLEEQKKLKSQATSSPDNENSGEHPAKGINIITDVKTIVDRENLKKERIKELKKIAKENPASPEALSEESIKRMEEQGLSEQ
jgi:hypothetical protein